MSNAKPRVLFVYYTYTQQTFSVVEAMSDTFRAHGFEVTHAKIEFTDPRYAERFAQLPFRHVYLDLFAMFPGQLFRRSGQISVPDAVQDGEYDLVCIGSPTWWLTSCMPIRSFMKSDAAKRLLKGRRFAAFAVCRRYWRNNLHTIRDIGLKHGGTYAGGIHFAHAGGQILSLLSLFSYLGRGENRDRYLGVKIPSNDLLPDYRERADAFASALASPAGSNAGA